MVVRNKVTYSRKKQKRLNEKELKTGKKTAVFKAPYKRSTEKYTNKK